MCPITDFFGSSSTRLGSDLRDKSSTNSVVVNTLEKLKELEKNILLLVDSYLDAIDDENKLFKKSRKHKKDVITLSPETSESVEKFLNNRLIKEEESIDNQLIKHLEGIESNNGEEKKNIELVIAKIKTERKYEFKPSYKGEIRIKKTLDFISDARKPYMVLIMFGSLLGLQAEIKGAFFWFLFAGFVIYGIYSSIYNYRNEQQEAMEKEADKLLKEIRAFITMEVKQHIKNREDIVKSLLTNNVR